MSRRRVNPFGDYSNGVSVEEQASFDALHPLIAEDTKKNLATAEKFASHRQLDAVEENKAPATVEAQDATLPSPSVEDLTDRRTPPPRKFARNSSARGRTPLPPMPPAPRVEEQAPPSEETGPSYAWVNPTRALAQREDDDAAFHGDDVALDDADRENLVVPLDETFRAHMHCLGVAYGMDMAALVKMLAADRIRQDLISGFILPIKLMQQ